MCYVDILVDASPKGGVVVESGEICVSQVPGPGWLHRLSQVSPQVLIANTYPRLVVSRSIGTFETPCPR